MAYDLARDRVVLFGGRNSAGAQLGDTWAWDGSAWTPAATTGPLARENLACAFDAARNEVVLFGGNNGGTRLGDTWAWNGNGWAQVASSGPSARTGVRMAYDLARGSSVLFAGNTLTTNPMDTWLWNDVPTDAVGGDRPLPSLVAGREAVLYPNVPNPFNPHTEIRFGLARRRLVSLKLYDQAGALVRVLVAGAALDAGVHTMEWDATDGAARRVASGVYYLRLEAGDVSDTQRLVLLK
jgi:hypothetical protein